MTINAGGIDLRRFVVSFCVLRGRLGRHHPDSVNVRLAGAGRLDSKLVVASPVYEPWDCPMEKMLLLLDLAGTFVFALSGALAGVNRKLDIFGVLVLSFAAGNLGGIARDLLIGAVPPGAISDWRYLGVSLLAGLATFFSSSVIVRLWNPVLLFDAAGLALFAVAGSQKAVHFGLNPVMATALGMLTGVGGGMARDMLLAEIPTVLRADLYAVAALVGAAVVVAGHLLHLSPVYTAIAGFSLCFGLRVLAIRYHWRLPIAKAPASTVSPDHDGDGSTNR